MPDLLFNPEAHTYSRNGLALPSVTTILASVGIIDRQWFDDVSAWRGSVIHRTCELDDIGDLIEESVEEEVRPRLAAWRKFKQETGIDKFDCVEKPEWSTLGYAGTPDRICFAQKMVIDLKSGEPTKSAKIQTAAYAAFYVSPASWRRVIVRLKEDGSYNCRVYLPSSYALHFGIFRSALAVHQFKEQK